MAVPSWDVELIGKDKVQPRQNPRRTLQVALVLCMRRRQPPPKWLQPVFKK